MKNITHKIAIKKDRESMMKALTSKQGLSSWWTQDVQGEEEVGQVLLFRFGEGGFNMKVEKRDKNEVHWKVVGGPEEWLPTRVEFKIQEEEGVHQLYFSHLGWKDETPFHSHCSMRWATFLLSLKSYLEEGKGRPFPDMIEI